MHGSSLWNRMSFSCMAQTRCRYGQFEDVNKQLLVSLSVLVFSQSILAEHAWWWWSVIWIAYRLLYVFFHQLFSDRNWEHLQCCCSCWIMDISYQKALESSWLKQNPSLRYTYKQWETRRQNDWPDLLKKARPSLTLRISTDRSFYDALLSKCVFTKRTIENFRVS